MKSVWQRPSAGSLGHTAQQQLRRQPSRWLHFLWRPAKDLYPAPSHPTGTSHCSYQWRLVESGITQGNCATPATFGVNLLKCKTYSCIKASPLSETSKIWCLWSRTQAFGSTMFPTGWCLKSWCVKTLWVLPKPKGLFPLLSACFWWQIVILHTALWDVWVIWT